MSYAEAVSSLVGHPTLYPMLFGGVPGFAPKAEDEHHARRGFVRVLAVLERGIDDRHFRGRSSQDMAHELWALVHGLAILEIKGGLGKPSRALRLWKDATDNLIDGFGRPLR